MCLTNLPKLAMNWSTENQIYGRTNNPYDFRRIPGGSSGGEGALIGAGGSIFGVGNDLGGSVRIPAFMCGIFGLKGTKGANAQFSDYHNSQLIRIRFGPIGWFWASNWDSRGKRPMEHWPNVSLCWRFAHHFWSIFVTFRNYCIFLSSTRR